MNRYGLIGYPLDHSFSPQYFNEKFYREGIEDAAYECFPLKDIQDFPGLITSTPGLQGLNVTIPYKEAVIPYMDELGPAAQSIGAVNTIAISGDKLIGHNTDAFAFRESLRPLLKGHHTRALILGTGGAAKAVAFALDQLKISFQMVSRNPSPGQISYQEIDRPLLGKHSIIINATPVGMAPDELHFPNIPYEYLSENHLLYDLVYNPGKTVFLIKGRQLGAAIKNGLEMLYLQADKSWDIWQEAAKGS